MKKALLLIAVSILLLQQTMVSRAETYGFMVTLESDGVVTASDTNELRLDNYYSSSVLTDQYDTYLAMNCFDMNPRTTWAEGEAGDGSNSYIGACWAAQRPWWIGGIAIRGGYQKSTDTYYNNNRPRTVLIEIINHDLEENVYYEGTLLDTFGWQYIIFDDMFYMGSFTDVSLQFEDVYSGIKYNDLCVSDFDIIVVHTDDRTDDMNYYGESSTNKKGSAGNRYLGTMTVVDCNSFVSLRERPDTQSARLMKVYKWENVEAYYYNSTWCECYYKGQHGYILYQYLTDRPGKCDDYPGNYASGYSDKYDLNQYEYRPVITKGRGKLVFQTSPQGSFMSEHKFTDGDWVYVNIYWRDEGYAIAYEDGEYGYVDASYIDW